MKQQIGYIALLVHDYDDALHYFTQVLGFHLVSDTPLDQDKTGKRWVLVAPPGSNETRVLLTRAATPEQKALTCSPETPPFLS